MSSTVVFCEIQDTDGVSSFSLNPGVPSQFPDLSVYAANWTKYRAWLEFTYVNKVGSGTNGTVVLCYRPDPLATPPLNFTEASSTVPAVISNVWATSRPLCVPANPMPLFLRHGPSLPVGEDGVQAPVQEYDMGLLSILTDGLGSELPPPGYLMCTYRVEMLGKLTTPPTGAETLLELSSISDNTVGFLYGFALNGPVKNPLVTRAPGSLIGDPEYVLWGFPRAGLWTIDIVYTNTALVGPPSSYYPFNMESGDSGILVYPVPASQWPTSGSLSTGTTFAKYLVYIPTACSPDPVLSQVGWLQLIPNDDGTLINHQHLAAGQVCLCGSQSWTDTLPNFSAAVAAPHARRSFHAVRKAPVPSKMDRLLSVLEGMAESSDGKKCSLAYPCLEVGCSRRQPCRKYTPAGPAAPGPKEGVGCSLRYPCLVSPCSRRQPCRLGCVDESSSDEESETPQQSRAPVRMTDKDLNVLLRVPGLIGGIVAERLEGGDWSVCSRH